MPVLIVIVIQISILNHGERDILRSCYCCLNYNEAYCPKQIEAQSICIDGDTDTLLERLFSGITNE